MVTNRAKEWSPKGKQTNTERKEKGRKREKKCCINKTERPTEVWTLDA